MTLCPTDGIDLDLYHKQSRGRATFCMPHGMLRQLVVTRRHLPNRSAGKPISTRQCQGGIGNAYLYATTPHMFEVRCLYCAAFTVAFHMTYKICTSEKKSANAFAVMSLL